MCRFRAEQRKTARSATSWGLVICFNGRCAVTLAKTADDGRWRPVLASRALVRSDDLVLAIEDVGLLFDPARLEMLIHRLRQKVLKKCRQPLPLIAVRGVGYTLALH